MPIEPAPLVWMVPVLVTIAVPTVPLAPLSPPDP
jgi:hypothetical protein